MDIDTLYGGLRWSIIERIAQSAKSPLELAKELQTSIANISMHLRVLEAASVVKKERIANSKAGEPRIIYSLTQDILLISYASTHQSYKQTFDITPEKKVLLSIWQLPIEVHAPLSSFYFTNQLYFTKQYNVFFESHTMQNITIIVSNTTVQNQEQQQTITVDQKVFTITIKFVSVYNLDSTTLKSIHRGITLGEKP
jgi:DNA-binding transcriptional ArsR family regulator